MKDVQKRTENVNTDEDPSGWRPYFTFIENLREKYAKNESYPGKLPIAFNSFESIFNSHWALRPCFDCLLLDLLLC